MSVCDNCLGHKSYSHFGILYLDSNFYGISLANLEIQIASMRESIDSYVNFADNKANT